MHKFVWDTSALLSIKEPNDFGYSPGNSLFKDFSDGWLEGPYLNIFPSIAYFELQASISRKLREGTTILREYYILNDRSEIYPIDQKFVASAASVVQRLGFDQLRGADLIFACIAQLEGGTLVTLDKGFEAVSAHIDVLDLNESRNEPKYRSRFQSAC